MIANSQRHCNGRGEEGGCQWYHTVSWVEDGGGGEQPEWLVEGEVKTTEAGLGNNDGSHREGGRGLPFSVVC